MTEPPKPNSSPLISEEQAGAYLRLRQQAVRLEGLSQRTKRGIQANTVVDLQAASHHVSELASISQQLQRQIDDYLPLLSGKRAPVNLDTIKPDRRGNVVVTSAHVLRTYTRLNRAGYSEAKAGPSCTREKAQELHAVVQTELGQELLPSTLEWPEEVALLKPSTGLESLFHWADQRHRGWTYRQRGVPREEWQDIEPYMQTQSFCNAYRVLDAVSQHVVEISNDAISQASFAEQLVRVITLKIFNEWRTYAYLCDSLGEEPSTGNLDPARYETILNEAQKTEKLPRLFRPAYRPGLGMGLLQSLQQMIQDNVAQKILSECRNLYDVAALLQQYNGVGHFFAAQWTLDLAYGPHLEYPLDDFCLAGPGAIAGIALSFMPRDWTYREINEAILMLQSCQRECFHLVTRNPAPLLEGRMPFPMDVQNFHCENQKFLQRAAHPYHGAGGQQPPPKLPPWWCGSSQEKEEARMIAEYTHAQHKRDGNSAAANLIARLKRRLNHDHGLEPEPQNSL